MITILVSEMGKEIFKAVSIALLTVAGTAIINYGLKKATDQIDKKLDPPKKEKDGNK